MQLPFIEGKGKSRRVYNDAAEGPALDKLRSSAPLHELQTDYAFFTYAPLFLYGGLEHNPVDEWLNIHGYGKLVSLVQLEQPILHIGSDQPIWNHMLWAVELEYWPSLSLHIGSLALLDRGKRKFTRAICQVLPIPYDATRTGVETATTVNVSTFSVDSNLGCLVFEPAGVVNHGKPRLTLRAARPETIKLGNALLADSPNPYAGVASEICPGPTSVCAPPTLQDKA